MGGRQQITSKQKAAMLLISLGPEKSAKVFKYLKEEEIEELTLEIANIKAVSSKDKEEVLQEFYEICLAQEYISEGGIAYAKQLLEQALGAEKAIDVVNKLTMALQVRPFEFARKTDAAQLLNFIQNEHPQTIALILSYLKPSQASAIITALPVDKQADIAKRIAVMDRASPDVINEIEKEFEKRLSTLVSEEYTTIGGVDSIVDIINLVDRATEKNIMEHLEIEDPELADTLKKRMFVFEDIVTLDSRYIQRVLREVDNHELAIALKGTNETVKEVIFNNVSNRLATMIQEDLEYMGPKRMKEIEDAQQRIVNVIRKLEEVGEVVISRGGGDEIVV
ncbi:MAG: flagellar motor switch protein FliG [Cellulosilyticaceae bacterium]